MPNETNFFEQPISLATTTVVPNAVIPFNTGNSILRVATKSTGASSNILALNFGTTSADLYDVYVGVSSTMVFYPSNTNFNAYLVSSDVFAATISMEVEIGVSLYNATVSFNPYVALAIAPSGSNSFTILPETITAVSFPSGTTYPIGTIQFLTQTFALNKPIIAGTRLAVVAGLQTQGTGTLTLTPAANTLNFSGGVALY